jgi:hypothetical protein
VLPSDRKPNQTTEVISVDITSTGQGASKEQIMNYMDKIMDYLDKSAVLSKLGLEPRPSAGERIASALGLFGVGMLLGAGAALFLAPMRGRDLRDRVRRIQKNGIGLKVKEEGQSSLENGFAESPRAV